VLSLTIVTINRNNSIGLQKTLKSIIAQTYSRVELIIVDGASSDNSMEVVNDTIASNVRGFQLITISEPDSGIYNAMNKGLKYATGDYIFFLNSGDVFIDDRVVETVFSEIINEDVIYGNICIERNNKIKTLHSNPQIKFFEKYQHDMPPHPATFVRRTKISELGGFDEEYRIISDVILIMKLFSDRNTKYKFLDTPITIFNLDGISSQSNNEILIYNERRNFITSNYPNYLKDFENIYTYKKPIYRFKFFRHIFAFFNGHK
jgi:glycosyltransferase involved in cell wall biosynthesis